MNANLAKAIRHAEALLLGRQYNQPLRPQLVKAVSSKRVTPIPTPAFVTRRA